MGNPVVSFSRIGQVAFNQSAARILKKRAAEFVLLLWDAEEKKIALKVSDSKDPRAYSIRYNEKGNGASFSAKTFLDHVQINYANRQPIPVDISDSGDIIVEFSVPIALFAKEKDATA